LFTNYIRPDRFLKPVEFVQLHLKKKLAFTVFRKVIKNQGDIFVDVFSLKDEIFLMELKICTIRFNYYSIYLPNKKQNSRS